MDGLPNFIIHGASRAGAPLLLDLRTALRGGYFDKNKFMKEMNLIDDTIVNFAPRITRFENLFPPLILIIQCLF